jgi:glycosyltransferase involved in cell wall biosynthesis
MTAGRKTRRRVLTVLNYYHPYVSGLTEYARLVAEGAASRGFDVTVLTGRHTPDLPDSEVVSGVRVVRATPLAFLHKGYISAQLFRYFINRIRSADVLHFHLPMLESGPLAAIGKSFVPLLSTYHCDVQRSGSGALLDAVAVRVVRRSCRLCLNSSSAIAVSSKDYAVGSEVLRGTEEKWVEIPPPDKGSSAAPVDSPNREAVRIGFLGRFVEEKGIGVLLEAAPQVLRRFPQAQFILAGNFTGVAGGSEYHRLRDRIESLGQSVQTPGYIPEQQLQDFYSSLDVFVLPSVASYEAFGMVQIEAMKAGVPVVATDMRGVRIPIQRTGNGVLVPPRQPSALADAIVKLLTEPRFRARTEISARAWAAFAPDRVIDRYVELYSALVEGTGQHNSFRT